MVLGAIDPLEGSAVILLGGAMVALGHYVGKSEARVRRFWVGVFALMAFGVAAMWGLSVFGGIGGDSGLSIWWGALILPYPIGWLAGVIAMIVGAVRWVRARRERSAQDPPTT